MCHKFELRPVVICPTSVSKEKENILPELLSRSNVVHKLLVTTFTASIQYTAFINLPNLQSKQS